jgi:hypothetical protein
MSDLFDKMADPKANFERRLRVLCGYVENASDTVVKVSQDDATREWVVVVGSETRGTARRYYGASMDEAFEKAFTDPKNDPV